jgi:predicted NBD/HSP70 family sugar kinase
LENVVSYDAMRAKLGFTHRVDVDQSDAGQELIGRYARYIGASVAPLVNALNPQLLVVSGPTSVVKEIVETGVRRGIEASAAPPIARAVQVRVADSRWRELDDEHGRFAVVSGAVRRVLDRHGSGYLSRLLRDELVAG